MAALNCLNIAKLPHHEKKSICASRAKYREGRKDTSVKVYTVNQESLYLLIQGVPAVGAQDDLYSLCEQYGILDDFKPLDEYPCEEFTEVFIVKFSWFSAARNAKKHLDDKSFVGGTLHVCYAPEFETLTDTRNKLNERRKFVAWRLKGATDKNEPFKRTDAEASRKSFIEKEQSSTGTSFKKCNTNATPTESICHQPVTYIWAGKEYTVYQPQLQGTANSEPRSDCLHTNEAKKHPFQSPTTLEKDISKSAYYGNIRKKVLSTSVPNMKVGFKRRRKI